MAFKAWKYIKKGDNVAIVAPGYGGKSVDLQRAAEFLVSYGLVPKIPVDIFSENILHSNNDDYRFEHLKKALFDKEIKAIWCFKGGYGTAKLLDKLSKLRPPSQPKALLGFSDITALHLFLGQKWHWSTVHAPVLWQVSEERVALESLHQSAQLLLGKILECRFSLEPMNHAAHDVRILSSFVTGGNICMIQSSLCTPWQIQAKGSFVFMEEVGERAYRIDRMLLQFMQSGIFNKAKAILLGDFTEEPDEMLKINTILHNFARSINIPVLRLLGVGHGNINNPLPLHTETRLHLGTKPELIVSTGGIASRLAYSRFNNDNVNSFKGSTALFGWGVKIL